MSSSTRHLRVQLRGGKQQEGTNRRVQAFGLRVGYWPCLRAPFVALSVGSLRFDLWWGDETGRR